MLANESFNVGNLEDPSLVGDPCRTSGDLSKASLDPPADNCPVVDTEDSLEVTEAQALHPARTTPALQTLDDPHRGALDTESSVRRAAMSAGSK